MLNRLAKKWQQHCMYAHSAFVVQACAFLAHTGPWGDAQELCIQCQPWNFTIAQSLEDLRRFTHCLHNSEQPSQRGTLAPPPAASLLYGHQKRCTRGTTQYLAAAASQASNDSKLFALPWQPPYLSQHSGSRGGSDSSQGRRAGPGLCGNKAPAVRLPPSPRPMQGRAARSPRCASLHPTPSKTHTKGMHFWAEALQYQRGRAARQGPVTAGSEQKEASSGAACGGGASQAGGRAECHHAKKNAA